MKFLDLLRSGSVELDQRMMRAVQMASSLLLTDSQIFLALYHLNSISTRFLTIDDSRLQELPVPEAHDYRLQERTAPGQIELEPFAWELFERIVRALQPGGTLGVRHFLKAVIQDAVRRGEKWGTRPWTVDLLLFVSGRPVTASLSKAPSVLALLKALEAATHTEEDFQYVLTLEGDRIAFRVTSVLDDYVQEPKSGLYLPQRAILTHFKDQFGGFTVDEIEELQDLLNSPNTKESDLQSFFGEHRHFFRRWDYREVYPHVVLVRAEGDLVPDFILTDRKVQKAAVLDLKLPRPKLIRRQQNRDRFASAVMEARAQLLTYRDWFRDKANRMRLKRVVGMEIYEPHLIVIIGRASEFQDEFDRQRLASHHPDIEVVTYDDIVNYAQQRRIIIQG